MRTISRDIVGAFIFSSDSKLLLGKTAAKAGGVYSGQWVIPGGGVEAGETHLQAMQREMLEETQLDVMLYDTIMTDNSATGESVKTLKETGEQVLVHMTFTDYEIRIPEVAERINARPTEELVELQWIEIHKLADADLSPPTREYLLKHGYIQ